MKNNLGVWLAASILLGAIGFAASGIATDWPPLQRFSFQDPAAARSVAIAANWLWLFTMLAAPFFLRWRALWLLVALPLVLFWPYVDYEMTAACMADAHACP